MSAEVAGLLWAAVDERVSFLTAAIPRFAGKSTTSEAVLAMRPPEVPAHLVAGEPEEMESLRQAKLGGYLVVAEFSDAPVPGYIWGEPVRRVFDTLEAGYALQASLHAPSALEAVLEVTQGNRVRDAAASAIGLVLYIERFGTDLTNFWRRLVEVYEVDRVEDGRPVGRSLYRWLPQTDRFEMVDQPRNFARGWDDVISRAEVLAGLASAGRTSNADLQAALARYRGSRG
jgi:hypothetical protein